MSGPLQSSSNHLNSSTTLSLTLTGVAGGTGDMIVVYCGSPTGARTFTVSDGTNSYHVDASNSPRASVAIATLINPPAGTNNITITMSGAATQILGVIEEWVLFFMQSPVDQAISNNSGAVSAQTGNTNTTNPLSQSGELVLSACVTANLVTSMLVSSPWTAGPQSPVSTANGTMGTSYGTSSSAAGQIATYTWINSVQWGAAIACYPQPIVTVFNPVNTQTQFFTQDRLLVS